MWKIFPCDYQAISIKLCLPICQFCRVLCGSCSKLGGEKNSKEEVEDVLVNIVSCFFGVSIAIFSLSIKFFCLFMRPVNNVYHNYDYYNYLRDLVTTDF